MTTHITLTTLVVFLALAAFGAVVFALAHFASHGTFSPTVTDDAAPTKEDLPEAAGDEDLSRVRHSGDSQRDVDTLHH